MQEHAYFTCHNGVIGEMFVGAEKADKVNEGELIYPVVAICLENCVVPHIDNEIENQHNAVFYAFKSLRFCRINVGVSFDEVRGIVFYALKTNHCKFRLPQIDFNIFSLSMDCIQLQRAGCLVSRNV